MTTMIVLEGTGTWTAQEHERFLQGLNLYPKGPWKNVAEIVQTRTVRQIRTHAQKYREKLARHQRGLRLKSPIKEERIDPLSVDEIDTFDIIWEPLSDSCSRRQYEESLEFLLEAFSDEIELN